MKRNEIIESIFAPILEMSGIIAIFFASYHLRFITDGIPFVQLRIPYISESQFLPFVISWALFWWSVFASGWLYKFSPDKPLFEQIRETVKRSTLWFFLYIWFVYLSTGFLFQKEIPRLIIIYVWIFSTIFSVFNRSIIYTLMGIWYKKWYLKKKQILVIWEDTIEWHRLEKTAFIHFIFHKSENIEEIHTLIREKKVETVLSLYGDQNKEIQEIVELCAIYGITFAYPQILPYLYDRPKHDGFIGWIPVTESSSVTIWAWERVGKRGLDILFSGLWLILCIPLFILIGILIKIEDPSGPIFFKNRRVGMNGNEFFLFKFRYMYWKHSIKDAYGISEKDDTALKYEENLKKENDTRDGPLYKIKNDPRKTRIGKILERLSIDELPQLWNVFIWDMSLIWPRPHQPREVALYQEHHFQVLTIKPGITGMAQVYGREKNTFEEEIALDTYYIEHYSILLDILILARTLWVVMIRAFR